MTNAIPNAALDDRLGFLGMTGSGKTFGAGTCVERILHRKGRVIVPDPLGVWWGLRLMADGKTASPYDIVIFGGPHGDMPLTPHAGALVGEAVATMRESAIIDLSQFATAASERRFMLAFLDALYRKSVGEPVHIVFDEADQWCLDEKTELLTDQGWITHDQVREGHRAVCFDLETNTYSYGAIKRMIVRNYSGPMIRLRTKSLDCLATPDHRVVLRRVQRAKGRYGLYPWTFCRAGEVPSSVGIPAGGAPIGSGVPGLTHQVARILGWIITDGCRANRGRALAIDQSISTIKLGVQIAQQMSLVLAQCHGVSRYYRVRGENYSQGRVRNTTPSFSWYLGKDFSREMLAWLEEDIHRIPRRILEHADHGQLQALFTGLLEGDGSSTDGKRWTHFYPGISEGLADDFQELALRLGVSTSKTKVKGRNDYSISIAARQGTHWLRRRTEETYSGTVWDITVPTGAFVARRNGRVFVTGNCPERIQDREGEATKLHGMMQNVVRRGRIKGLTSWLISQRPAALSKNVLSQVDGLVAFRLTASQDRKALGLWIEGQADREAGKAILGRLPEKTQGQAVVWLPARGVLSDVTFPPKVTYDSSRAPKRGETRRVIELQPLNLDALKDKLATVEAEVKANDPKALKAEIARLKAEATKAAKNTPTVDPKAIESARCDGYQEGAGSVRGRLGALAVDLENTWAKLRDTMEAFGQQLDALKDETKKVGPPRAAAVIRPPMRAKPLSTVNGSGAARKPLNPGDGTIPGPQRQLLQALAWWAAMGHERPTRVQAATICGWRVTSGHIKNVASALRTAGLVDYPSEGVLCLTATGAQAAPAPDTSTTLIDSVRAVLTGPQRQVFEFLHDRGAEASREQITEALGWEASSGHIKNVLSSMRSLEVVDYPSQGHAVLAEWIQ